MTKPLTDYTIDDIRAMPADSPELRVLAARDCLGYELATVRMNGFHAWDRNYQRTTLKRGDLYIYTRTEGARTLPDPAIHANDADALLTWMSDLDCVGVVSIERIKDRKSDQWQCGAYHTPMPTNKQFENRRSTFAYADNWKHATTKAAVLLALRLEVSE